MLVSNVDNKFRLKNVDFKCGLQMWIANIEKRF